MKFSDATAWTDGVSGTMREIGLFTTLLLTRDLIYISVPNAAIFGGVITNCTCEPLRREIVIGKSQNST